MNKRILHRLATLAAAALLGAWAPEAQAQCTPPATVQAGVVRDGNDLVVQIKPSANVPGTEYIAGMTLTVKYTDDANVSLGTATWASAAIGQAWDGFFATTAFLGQVSTVSNGGYKYTTYVTENSSFVNLATSGVTLSANTTVDLLRIPLTITNNACAVFSVENDTYTGNNNLDWYIAFSGCDAQNGFFGTQVAPVVNGNTGIGYCTIQSAIDAAQTVNGHTILVSPGTYIASNILVSKQLTIRGTGASRSDVVIVPAAEDGNVDNAFASNAQNGFLIRANNVKIQNLTINGRGNPALTPGKNNFRIGIVSADASYPGGGGGQWNNLHVDNVHILYPYRRGISVFPRACFGTLIENSLIENVAFNHAMYVGGQSQILNNVVNNAFQGIVCDPDGTTTNTDLVKVNGNTLSGIGNFPGCWGYPNGQPRAIQCNPNGPARTFEVKNNTISDNGLQQYAGAVGIYTRLWDKNSVIQNNTITLTSGDSWANTGGAQAVGMLLGWSYDNGILVTNNVINSTNYGIGMMVHGNGTLANPLRIEGNTLTSTNSSRLTGGDGDGAGIYVSNQYLFASTDRSTSYAIIRNDNTITGYVKGVEVIKGALPEATQALTVQVLNNDASISGNGVGIDANYGDITITGNDIHSNGTGVRLSAAANLVSATNNLIRDNSGDGIRIEAGTSGSIGAISNNSFTNNTGLAIKDLRSASSLTATCNWYGSTVLSTIQSAVSGNVTVVPFLTNGADNDGSTAGFQPAPNSCNGGPVRVYTDATETTFVSAHLTIQAAINAATTQNGYVVRVDAGTYAEQVSVSKAITLRGANTGTALTACGETRLDETVINGSTGAAITIASNGVTVDGFELQGAIGLTSTAYTDLVVSNNKVNTVAQGISVAGATTSATDEVTITGNAVTLSTQAISTTPTTGIVLASVGGTAAATVSNNLICGGFYGYALSNVTTTPRTVISGGSITGVMQGVAAFNSMLVSPFTNLPMTVGVDGITMSGFTGNVTAIPDANFHAGVYVFTGGADNSAVVNLTVNNVDISGVGNHSAGSTALYFADFSTATALQQNVVVTNSYIHDNLNRGVDVRGVNAVASISNSDLIRNGADGYDDYYGRGVMVRNGAQVTVSNCNIVNPATGNVYAINVPNIISGQGAGVYGILTVQNSSILGNGNTSPLVQVDGAAPLSGPAASLTATCNWWGVTSAQAVASTVNSAATTYTNWLISGTDTDLATRGFQPAAGTCIGQPFTLSATSLNVSCFGLANGSIDLTVTGGVAPFTYAWTNSATTQDLSGLAPDTYNVTVTDSLGTTGTLATAITISEPAAVVLSASATPILCFGETSELTASATGADSLRVNGVLYTAALSGLTPDVYTVIAYGTNGNNNGVCTDTVVVTITQPAAALGVSTSVTDATCNTNSDGQAVATATGGTTPYGYSWNDGAAQTTATATGLGVGSYSVTVTDANGCTANAGATIGQAPHSGSTWYVATTGSNSNNGNAGCPVQTIQFAINSATAGDVVDVAAGTYTEQVTLNKANITLRSADGNATTFIENPIVGSETAGVTAVANMGTLTLDGFTVNNFRNGIMQGMASATGTTFIVQNNKVIPENNATNPYLRNGIQVTGNGSQVLNNYVVGAPLTSTWASTGILVVNASNALVEGNTVNTASADIGITVLNYNVDAVNGVTVRNNTVHNAKNGIRLEGGPVATGAPRKLVSNTLIEGNVLTNSPTSSGINAQSVAVEGLTVTGNIITGHTQYAVRFSNTTAVLSGVISINENILTGTIGGLFNGPGYAINATCNWWGSDVPADVLGDILGGGNVTFIPWLLDDSDLSPSIGFQPGGACAGYPVTLTVKAMLQGAFEPSTGLMRDNLRSLATFPTSQPFAATYGYTGTETINPAILSTSGSNAIVDWVLLEVRDDAAPATIMARRAALIQRDGDIVETDGSTPIYLWELSRDFYHVSVRHRNHLGAMTATSQYLGTTPSLIDFTAISTYGTDAQKQLVPGVKGLWSGNTRRDGSIKYTGTQNDRDIILLALPLPSPTSVLANTYNAADVNLDGSVKYTGANNDRDPILQNIGGVTPTATRLEQLP